MQLSVLFLALSVFVCGSSNVEGYENLIGTPVQKCINCLCHAVSGCWSRFNCARYSVPIDYWRTAGEPSIGHYSTSEENYKSCMGNENCILNTIKSYTDRYQKDCNCDGDFDCKDRLAIHRFGDSCYNPEFGIIVARRFNDCAKSIGVDTMLAVEGDSTCGPTVY